MIERMIQGGKVSVGEAYQVIENGQSITVRSIGPCSAKTARLSSASESVKVDTATEHKANLKANRKSD